MKLVYEGISIKEFRVIGNLNGVTTRVVMANLTLHIEMRAKVSYSFKSEIDQGADKIVDYNKTLTSPPGMFTSLKEIQAYIEACEQNLLDLENTEVWSMVCLPAARTTETKRIYLGKVIFKHVQIRVVASNEPLMGCGPLPN